MDNASTPVVASLGFDQAVQEYAKWRSMPDRERSPAPASWWQPAVEMLAKEGEMPPTSCGLLELPIGSTWCDGADVLMGTLAEQSSPSWSDEPEDEVQSD